MAAISHSSGSPPLLVSVAARAAHAFTPSALIQGLASHGRGVDVLASHDDRFSARVRSKRTHDVTLRGDAGRLTIACSCPAMSLGMSGCKHAWAALLEADRRGGLRALRDARTPLPVEMLAGETESPADPPQPTTKRAPRPGVAKANAAARSKHTPSGGPRTKTAKAAPPPKKAKKQARRRADA